MNKIIEQLATHRHARIAYILATIFSVSLFTIGFFVPPMGKIDGSVLIAGGSVMLFTLAYIALAFHSNVQMEVDIDDRKFTLSSTNPKPHEES